MTATLKKKQLEPGLFASIESERTEELPQEGKFLIIIIFLFFSGLGGLGVRLTGVLPSPLS